MKEIEGKVSSLSSLQLNDLLFADDFVGLSDSKEGLQDMINVVHAYSKKWCFEANVTKCAVVLFRNASCYNNSEITMVVNFIKNTYLQRELRIFNLSAGGELL